MPLATLQLHLRQKLPLLTWLSLPGLLLLGASGWLSWPPVLVLSLLFSALLLTWARRRLGPFIGPLYFYELVRLARRGRTTLLRFGYGLVLLATLCCFYSEHFPNQDLVAQAFTPGWNVPVNDTARFSRQLVFFFLTVQSIALYVLTPIYLGGAIAEEKERRTFELLLTTHLSSHEIILGKLLARLTHLLLLLLMGLPILCLTSLLGGVHYLLLLAGFVATLVSLLTVGSLSICVSVLSRTTLGAISSIYGILLIFLCCIVVEASPASFVMALENDLGRTSTSAPFDVALTHLGVYTVLHGLVAVFCLGGAIFQLRTSEDLPPLARTALVPSSPGPPLLPHPDPPFVDPALPSFHWPTRISHPEVLDDQPLVWKEAYRLTTDLESYFSCLALVLFVYVLALFVPFGVTLSQLRWQQGLNRGLRGLFVVLMSLWCVLTAFRTVGSLSRERHQGTLDGLLLLPFSRRAILRAYVVGGIARFRSLGFAAAACLAIGLVSGAFHPLAVVLLVLVASVHLALQASLGVWLALVSGTPLWAYVKMGLVLLLFFGGPWLLILSAPEPPWGQDHRATWDNQLIEAGLNPLACWWLAGFSWDDLERPLWDRLGLFHARLQAIQAGLGLYTLGTCALWAAAVFHLRSLKKGG